MRQLLGLLAVLNLLAATLFAGLAFLRPPFSELSARIAYTELDRAGAINAAALDPNSPTYGFDPASQNDHRRTVPVFVAAGPLAAARTNAIAGLLASAANAAVTGAAWATCRRLGRAPAVGAGIAPGHA
jgi:hypothetical protein